MDVRGKTDGRRDVDMNIVVVQNGMDKNEIRNEMEMEDRDAMMR